MTLPFPDHAFGAFLFDMDGTLLSSIAAAERVWSAWATRHGLDVAAFLPTIHGVRASETIRALNLPGVDVQAEVDALTQAEMDDIEGIESIAGAAAFLTSLPADRWAIVTSAPRQLAIRRLTAAGIPLPPLMVAGEDVTHGKPAPDCFLLAARQLDQQPHDCLVFEDAPAGIRAAEAAGARVVVVTATHSHRFETAHPTIPGYEALAPLTDTAGRLVISGLAGRAA
jgi:sugar-phosphatase